MYLVVCALACAAVPNTKPNIVFIVSDDLGFNDVSMHGMSATSSP